MTKPEEPDYFWLALERMAEEGTLPEPDETPDVERMRRAVTRPGKTPPGSHADSILLAVWRWLRERLG